jgi:NDP-sugar pyrophosphorylase family protein
MKARHLFDLPPSLERFEEAFHPDGEPWAWVAAIRRALEAAGLEAWAGRDDQPPGLRIVGPVFIDPSVELPPFGSIQGPAWIGPDCELRPGVFVRGNVIVGRGCVLGNSCEYKNSLLLEEVATPHFNYVGDSVLGNGAHLGAGAILSNLRFDKRTVRVADFRDNLTDTGMKKLGALLGDEAEVGCNAVLQPGAILGKRAIVMSSMALNGTIGSDKVAYIRQEVASVQRKH